MSNMKTHYKRDVDGATTDADLAHSKYFAHYGTKGMKWGVRKRRVTSGVKRAVKGQIAKEKAAIKGLNEGDNVMGIPTTKAQAKKNWQANMKNNAKPYRKLGLNKVADIVENQPVGGYEVAAARKVGSGLKKTSKKANQWIGENPEKAVAIGLTLGLATSMAVNKTTFGSALPQYKYR